MMRRALSVMTALAMAVTVISTVAAQEKEPPIVGLWQATMETPHGKMELAFDFQFNAKEKKNVSGTVTSATMGSFPLSGEFTGGQLTFAVTGGPGEMTFSGSLKDRNTLVGVMSAHTGDLECVAKRVQK
jgi:hypothetical protein